MKSLEELATTTTEVTAMLPKVIIDEVEESARTRRFGRSLVRINDDLVRTKGRSIVIGRRGTLTASAVSEGSSPTESTLSYTSHTITPSKIGTCAKISQEAIDGLELNLIKEAVTEAGIALADKEDEDIVHELIGYETDTAVASGAETISTGDKILEIVSDPADVVSSVDYYDGKIVTSGAGTITYAKTTRTYVKEVSTAGSLVYKDIAAAAGDIRARKWKANFLLVHPNQYADLLNDDRFIDTSRYGAREPIVNGELGKIGGMKVLVSTQIPDGVSLVVDSTRAGWLAIKRNIDLKRWDNPQTDSVELYFYMEYGVAVTDEDAIVVLVNSASDAVDL